jgi:putative hydrolase of the HAD superfamily
VELDRGTIELEQAIDRGATRTGLPSEDIERLLGAVPRFLTPIEATIDLIHDLSHTENRLFVLSNMHLASIAYLEQHHKIWDLFDGIVISSRIQMVKPELQIYEYLLKLYRLEPAETVFIDDLHENLVAASSVGIKTIQFVDSAQCARALEHFR